MHPFRNCFDFYSELKACLNFPLKSFYQFILSLFSICFPVFTRQIARYPPHKNRKTSSKITLKIILSKI